MAAWRQIAQDTIRETLATVPADADEAATKKLLSAAYPFGERSMHPYKIWLKEVRDALDFRYRGVGRYKVSKKAGGFADDGTQEGLEL